MEIKQGLIVKAVSDMYYVDCGEKVYSCKARGKFRNISVKPLVGDKVTIEIDNSTSEISACIVEVAERSNSMIRPAVANIDILVIVSSVSLPKPSPAVIDKITAAAEYRDIMPAIVFNKVDEGKPDKYLEIYSKTNYPFMSVSARTGEGIEHLKKLISGKIVALCGNSGVGKSSILNCLCSSAVAATGEISEKLRRGKHTTRHVELVKTDGGGYIADTPGFSSWEFTGKNHIPCNELQYCFSEFKEYIGKCKFTSCTHIKEQGCAVIEAAAEGKISYVRHKDYVEMYNELKSINDWEL